jgi:hypothetical protein
MMGDGYVTKGIWKIEKETSSLGRGKVEEGGRMEK